MKDQRIVAVSNEPFMDATSASAAPKADAIRAAHRVLRPCLPNTSLPTDLSKLRTMLDAYMFGRDRRELRDDAVRVAWQIDSLGRQAERPIVETSIRARVLAYSGADS